MATIVGSAQATENLTAESGKAVITNLVPSAAEDPKKAETAETMESADQHVTSTTVTTAVQPNEEVKIECSSKVVASDVPSAAKDLKMVETDAPKEDALATGHNAMSTTATAVVPALKTEDVKIESGSTAVGRAETSVVGEVKDLKGSAQDSPSTPATTVVTPPKTDDVKIESVSTVIAGVVGDLKNAEVGVAKEAVPVTGKNAPNPSLETMLEGGLRIVEKEAEKGVAETVATVEQHPELIAEGALAAVIGAASLVQPELLPGAVAMVGKMASDNAKKTVTKIATDEGKKVATAIAKDVSNDAAKEKAAGAAASGTSATAKSGTDGVKSENSVHKDALEVKPDSVDSLKDTPKALEASNGHVNVHEVTGKPAVEQSAESETAEQLSPPQQPPKTAVMATVSSSVTTTTKTATKAEPDVPLENQLGAISQESLVLLHKKIDAMNDAIKHIAERLALHLPPTTPAVDASKQITAEAMPSGLTSESEVISPAEAPAVPKLPAADTDTPVKPATETAEQSPNKRPTLEKRNSVLSSMGKIFWPFGSSSSTKTVVEQTGSATTKSDTPKVPTVTVSEVTSGPEIAI